MKQRSWLLLLPPVFLLFSSTITLSTPGGMVPFYLIGAGSSLAAVAYGAHWVKYIGILICCTFLIAANAASDHAVSWTKLITTRFLEEKYKAESTEQGAAANP